MYAQATDQPRTESPLEVASSFAVGLGVVTFALFPLLVPGLALLALGVAPLVLLAAPVALVGGIIAAVWLGVRAVGRRVGGRERLAPGSPHAERGLQQRGATHARTPPARAR